MFNVYKSCARELSLSLSDPSPILAASISSQDWQRYRCPPMSSPDIQDAPPYKVAPVTKIRVEPSKALKSPFLVKRQYIPRPDTKILKRLYHDITTTIPSPIWQKRFKNLPELVKIEENMNTEQKKEKRKNDD